MTGEKPRVLILDLNQNGASSDTLSDAVEITGWDQQAFGHTYIANVHLRPEDYQAALVVMEADYANQARPDLLTFIGKVQDLNIPLAVLEDDAMISRRGLTTSYEKLQPAVDGEDLAPAVAVSQWLGSLTAAPELTVVEQPLPSTEAEAA